MGKLLWGISLSETTGCCQCFPVAIPGRDTETETISAVMTNAVREEPSSLPFTVKKCWAQSLQESWIGAKLLIRSGGLGMKRGIGSAFLGILPSAALHPWQGDLR